MFFKDKVQYCPGEVCELKDRQEIQKVSKVQLLIVIALIAFVWLLVVLFNDFFSVPPFDMFGINK